MAGSGAGDGGQEPQGGTDAPWAADLAERFEDENVRGQVDAYIREKIQPRTTQLEQQVAEAGDAVRLWNDFRENPEETMLAAAAEIYGTENLTHFEQALRGVYGIEEQQAAEAAAAEVEGSTESGTEEPPEYELELPEHVEYASREYIRERENREWDEAVETVSKENPDIFPWEKLEDRKSALAPFVIAADGDLDTALESYKAWFGQIRAGNVTPEEAAAEAAAAGEAALPNPVGNLGGQNPSVPVEKQYDSIGDAIADWAREEKAKKAPPPIGGV